MRHQREWSSGRNLWKCVSMRVYVPESRRADLLVLRSVLQELEAEIVDADDLSSVTWGRKLAPAWEEVDAVVAVITGQQGGRSETALVEAGIAIGRGIPLLVLSDEEVPLPLLAGGRVADITERGLLSAETLRFHLSLFLRRVERGESPVVREDAAREIDVRAARGRLAAVRQLPPPQRALQYEQWAEDLFRTAGGQVVSARDSGSRGFDFVASVPGFELTQGPLVVEVKGTLRADHLQDAALRLQYLVLTERAALGLLLFDDEEIHPNFALQTVPMVVVLGVGELLDLLERRKSLTRVLIHARNEAVHRI